MSSAFTCNPSVVHADTITVPIVWRISQEAGEAYKAGYLAAGKHGYQRNPCHLPYLRQAWQDGYESRLWANE